MSRPVFFSWQLTRPRSTATGLLFPLIVLTCLCGCTGAPETSPDIPRPAEATPVTETQKAPPSVSLDDVRDHVRAVALDGQSEETPAATQTTPGRTALPDLFEDSPEKKTTLSGKILTREEAESLTQSVDGVEFEVEVKLD